MRIVLVSDSYLPVLGGIELHVRDLAERLTGLGHTVDVVTRTPAEGDRTPVDLREVVPGAGRVVRLGGSAFLGSRLARVLAGADVVHAHSSVVSPLAWRAAASARAEGIPALVTVHSMLPHGATLPMAVALRAATAAGLRWTAVSTVVADPLSRTLGVPVPLLHNGIDPAPWRGELGGRSRREAAGSTFTVVSALRFAARKRPVALVRMLADLHRQLPPDVDLRAVLVGAGPLLEATRRRLSAAGLAGRVELVGRVDRDRVRTLLTQADVYLAPARLESFGLAALEARCAGLPVVAMASSGVTEFVRHDVEGLLARDDEHAVQLLRELAVDPARRDRIHRHNLATETDATWSRTLAATLQRYAEAGAGTEGTTRTAVVRPFVSQGSTPPA
ncbi:glycosyltransferase family 4 protein [Kineococcus gynurae]|uniref:Glycosyltransferase family 4 protein n=1 Tax=Kineococcus gynurae TaxID=452979 RepID=A0ABV5LSF4_9ACTN